MTGQDDASRLTPEEAFRRAAEAACRDGKVDAWESKLLNRLYTRLGLSKEKATGLVIEARRAAGEAPDGDAPLEAYSLYRDLLGLAFRDQELDAEEQQVLGALRELLEIEEDDHMAAVTELGLLGREAGEGGNPIDTLGQSAPEDEEDAVTAEELEAQALAEGELKSTLMQVRDGVFLYVVVALIVLVSLHGAGVVATRSSRDRWLILVALYLGSWVMNTWSLRSDERTGRVEVGPLKLLPFDLVYLPAALVAVPMTWGLWVWVERLLRGVYAGL